MLPAASQGYALTLQQLQYFLAAFRHGSFSAAAEELHLAQPSLSEQVRRLEAELGVRLFQRVGRGLTPTEAGHALRPHAERTLDAAEGARESVVAVRELRGGTATFGTWGTARYYPGVDLVTEFRRRHPNVRVRVVGQNSSEVADAIRSGELEAGMIALPIDDRGLSVEPIMRDEIVYACDAGLCSETGENNFRGHLVMAGATVALATRADATACQA